jgi:hypothetical protein
VTVKDRRRKLVDALTSFLRMFNFFNLTADSQGLYAAAMPRRKRLIVVNKSKVFMIMPFEPEFFEAYEMLKEHFSDEFEFSHAGDDIGSQQNILKDIVQMIYDAEL